MGKSSAKRKSNNKKRKSNNKKHTTTNKQTETKDTTSARPTSAAAHDPRFARMYTDPRFQDVDTRVTLDDRFKDVLSDNKFADSLASMKQAPRSAGQSFQALYRTAAERTARRESKAVAEGKGKAAERKKNKKKRKHQKKNKHNVNNQDSKNNERVLHEDNQDNNESDKPSSSIKSSEEEDDGDDFSDKEYNDYNDNNKQQSLSDLIRGRVAVDASDEEDEEGHRQALLRQEEEEDKELFSDDEFNDIDQGNRDIVDAWETVLHDDPVRTDTASHRIAVQNIDWNWIRATDLFALFTSFCPVSGVVHHVTVYVSDFGQKRMLREQEKGPDPNIFKYSDSTENNEEYTAAIKETKEYPHVDQEEEEEEEEEADGFNETKLREYELERLKYYFAVVECDSSRTAERLYHTLDGFEFETCSVTLDLRFVPDHISFEDRPVRESASSVPASYQAPRNFVSQALANTNLSLSWDTNPVERQNLLQKDFTEEDLDQLDFGEFLASSSEDESELPSDVDDEQYYDYGAVDVDKLLQQSEKTDDPEEGASKNDDEEDHKYGRVSERERYQKLLQEYQEREDAKLEEEKDMEVSFTPAEEVGAAVLERKKERERREEETPWETYLRRRKEKKKARQKALKAAMEGNDDVSEDNSDEDDENENNNNNNNNDNIENDKKHENDDENDELVLNFDDDNPFVTLGETTKTNTKPSKSSEEKQREELELLMADGSGTGNADDDMSSSDEEVDADTSHKNNIKPSSKRQKQGDFKVDLEDDRIQAVLSDPRFAIDPTNPNFKKTGNMQRILEEKQKYVRNRLNEEEDQVIADDKKKNEKKQQKKKKITSKKRKRQKTEDDDIALISKPKKKKHRI